MRIKILYINETSSMYCSSESVCLSTNRYVYMVVFQEDVCNKVDNFIIMTKCHETPVHIQTGVYGSDDAHYMLDFDMQVLGWAPTGQATLNGLVVSWIFHFGGSRRKNNKRKNMPKKCTKM